MSGRGERGAPRSRSRGRGAGDRGGRGGGGGRGTDDAGRGSGARGGRGGGWRGFEGRGRGGGGRGGRGGRGGAAVEVFSRPNEPSPVPDPGVTKLEDAIVKDKSDGMPDISRLGVDEVRYPRRPGYGTQGAKIVLRANYFQLTPANDLTLYRYHVDVQPAAAGKKLKRIFALLFETTAFVAIRDGIATDYRAIIISRVKLPPTADRVTVPYRFEDEDQPRAGATNYTFTIQETGTLTISELLNFLRSTNVNDRYNSKDQAIQALNIIMARSPNTNSNVVSPGRNRFFPIDANASRADLLGALQAIRGYFTSVRAATGRILININVSHSVFYEPGRLDQIIVKWGNENGTNRYKLEQFLKRVRVQVTHLKAKKPRIKTIFSLANKNDGQRPNPPKVASFGAGPKGVEFFQGDPPGQTPSTKPGAKAPPNKYISVFQFFKNEYNRTIANVDLPVVNVGNREKPVYLPAEVCVVVDGQSSRKKLSPGATNRMMRFAARKPPENARSIVGEGSNVIGLLPPASATLVPFGLSVTAEMITVPGRVLDGPLVKYRDKGIARARFGSWNMIDIKFTIGANIGTWSYLWFPITDYSNPFQAGGGPLGTVLKFQQMLGACGVTAPDLIEDGLRCDLGDNNAENDRTISEAFKKVLGHRRKPRFMLVILSNKDAAIYSRIKYIADTKAGIHTVCVVASKFAEEYGQGQYFANVALKFNLKGGGTNQSLDMNKLGILSEGKTMVVGIDVTHPSPGSAKDAPSVAGIVATTSEDLGQWPAELSVQRSRKEMVTDLKGLLMGRLKLWQSKNKTLPDNIIVYRDGVSEGQYETVLDEELPLLRAACEATYSADSTKRGVPKISIIIVGKRHHTRFYPTKEDDADRSSNPKNGTVVDRGVTEARNWNFFLQAHAGLQGTARPAHYFVVLDEIFAKRPTPPGQTAADALEQLTHNMCYLFGRATKAVSICPPAYYADLVCERARNYLRGIFEAETPAGTPAPSLVSDQARMQANQDDVRVHENLKDTMFYI